MKSFLFVNSWNADIDGQEEGQWKGQKCWTQQNIWLRTANALVLLYKRRVKMQAIFWTPKPTETSGSWLESSWYHDISFTNLTLFTIFHSPQISTIVFNSSIFLSFLNQTTHCSFYLAQFPPIEINCKLSHTWICWFIHLISRLGLVWFCLDWSPSFSFFPASECINMYLYITFGPTELTNWKWVNPYTLLFLWCLLSFFVCSNGFIC